MKNLLENTISWNKIGRHPKSEYEFSIGRAVISKESEILTIEIRLNFVVPFDDLCQIKSIILNEISGIKGVEINFEYQDVILTSEEVVNLFIEHMIYIVNGKFARITRTIDTKDYILQDDVLTINATGEVAVSELNKSVASLFEQLLIQNFGINVTISFVNNIEQYQKTLASFQDMEEEFNKKVIENEKNKPKAKAAESSSGGGFKQPWQKGPKKKDLVEGNKIMGKPISGVAKPLGEVTADDGEVVVEGIFFRMEEKAIRQGTKLLTMLITDKKTSLATKCFVEEDKYNDIKEHITPGTFVRMKGEARWDTFDNVISVMVKHISKGIMEKRKDTSERKRVELHIHTKMSAMDGISEAKSIVKTAAAWGHPAVAITDHGVVQSFPDAAKAAQGTGSDDKPPIKIIYGMEGYLLPDEGLIREDGTIEYNRKNSKTHHIILLAATQEGLKNIYKLVSISHLQYFYKKPRIPRSVLSKYREGIIVGSACEAGELFQSVLRGDSQERQLEIASFYDYLEIQPIVNNQFLVEDKQIVKDKDGLMDLNRQIVALADILGKPVVATTDAHYMNPEDTIYRRIIMSGGMGFKNVNNSGGLYFRTTDEMLEEFSYLGEEKAEDVVINNTNKVADMIAADIMPVPKGKFPPRIEGAEETLRKTCMERAYSIYGNPLPEFIAKRLDKELTSIIGNGYAVMYVSAQMLVNKSLEDGYLVGSRGSVGSSFAATMAGITEVNPLPPHYICPNCKNLEWGDTQEYDCGVDMPAKDCPKCGTRYVQDGYTIPFETFLGFNGDKEPDIDLNFAGEYQAKAHRYVGDIFGKDNVFKAGTVGTVAEKTAESYVHKYQEEYSLPINKFEVSRLAEGCTGVKRTTGQHPGGIIIVPDDHEIYEFCPVQHPANDTKTDIVTTHFDYHKIDQNLLKLDILGHDVPSMIRQLQDLTGKDPLTVPLDDKEVIKIFNGIEPLKITNPDYKYTHGSYAIPEFGTKFVRQMLDDTKPSKIADLVRISGFSHGTDVWLNNAQEFIRSGVATMREAISTRDDIMNYLILKGIENGMSFRIMEDVRKNRPLKPEQLEVMEEHGVPDWYVESCKRIQYMFPRAHAVAYVLMSFRLAWYKVYYPAEFYATYFTTKVTDFNVAVILGGIDRILARINELNAKGKNMTTKEEDEITVLEVAYEMYSRGFEFDNIAFGKSLGTKFTVIDGKVIPPFLAINGVGENAANSIADEYKVRAFGTVEEVRERTRISKTSIEMLREFGVLEGMPETDQICMF